MSSTSGAKRNRSDNFDPQDVDLLLSLIEEHARLIDSAQLEYKKKVCNFYRWIYNTNFNLIFNIILGLGFNSYPIQCRMSGNKTRFARVKNETEKHQGFFKEI